MIRYGNYIEAGVEKNSRFNLSGPLNRDNSNYPFWLLRKTLRKYEVELNTCDINANRLVDFEIHMNVHKTISQCPKYLLRYETPQIYPKNGFKKLLDGYQRIFTWDDHLVDDLRFIKINFTNKAIYYSEDDYELRDKLCCLIAGNKAVTKHDAKELYSQRVATIRWFENNAPDQFDLYGTGWELPAAHQGRIGRITNKCRKLIYKMRGSVAFPSYRGAVSSKFEILRKYRFSICYENVKELHGYITEKIFDSFFAGCIPVYWGASNVHSYIPKACFIDRARFENNGELYKYLKGMSEAEYRFRQKAIRKFLLSEEVRPFYPEAFADTISERICADLGILRTEHN